jgi:hypothetical protein
MPAVPDAENEFKLANLRVSFFNVPTSQLESNEKTFTVKRTMGGQDDGIQCVPVPNAVINKQRNRIRATAALGQASKLATESKYTEARSIIQSAIKYIEKSMTGQDPFCVALVGDLRQTMLGLQDTTSYTMTGGAQYLNNMWQSNAHQRSTATCFSIASPQMAQQCYTTNSRNIYRSIAPTSSPMPSPALPLEHDSCFLLPPSTAFVTFPQPLPPPPPHGGAMMLPPPPTQQQHPAK